jgi:hypothetical protein
MSIFSRSKTKNLEKAEKELKNKFFNAYKDAKDMIEHQHAKIDQEDSLLLKEVSDYCDQKNLQKVG